MLSPAWYPIAGLMVRSRALVANENLMSREDVYFSCGEKKKQNQNLVFNNIA